MNFTLIICTYERPVPLATLLESVTRQKLYPNDIIIVDGSLTDATSKSINQNIFKNLRYFKVEPTQRGLTRQRNFGIERVASESDIVCFLDDDTVLEINYFEKLLDTYSQRPDALGVGGYIQNEVEWKQAQNNYVPTIGEFVYDGWKRKDGSRFVLRKRLGLDSDRPPGYSPLFSHGRSVSFLPPSGKIYPVEQLMGGVSSFRKSVFDKMRFSEYFDGYGLYEDADFSLRLAKKGQVVINTSAKLSHYHDPSGRPNKFQYGKMVVRNGWYVWRVKNPNPGIKDRVKWHAITCLLTFIRLTNVVRSSDRRQAFTEAVGRTVGWFSLLFNNPK